MEKAEIIKAILKDRNITIKDLAKMAGIPYTTVYAILTKGIANSSFDNITRICNALNITPNELITASELKNDNTTYLRGESVYIPLLSGATIVDDKLILENVIGISPVPKEWIGEGEYFLVKDNNYELLNNEGKENLVLIKKQDKPVAGELLAVVICDEFNYHLELGYLIQQVGYQILQPLKSTSIPAVFNQKNIKVVGIVKRIITRP